MPPARKHPLPRRLAPVVGLFVLSPICAEYLIGYDQIVGHPWELLTGLLLLAPLYGAPALLIREFTRRTGRGWPTMLLLSAAFGLILAGLVDQSLFNPDFFDDPSWAQERTPTLVPALGISVGHVLNFLAGHVIWSFAAPIAVVEACAPDRADEPWLGKVGTSVVVVLYLSAALVFHHELTRNFSASPAQLGITAAIVLALAVAAFALPRHRSPLAERAPSPWLLAGAAVILLTAHQLVPSTWLGSAMDVLVLVSLGGLLWWWSARKQWNRLHTLAVGGAALVVNAALSFVVDPLGQVSYTAKYAANTVLMLMVLALLAWARHRVRAAASTTPAPQPLR
ncbi:hypothetical protein NGF19_26835 [Streptomyces sp. RY43-2]|uniref:Uncharacterized protein n=1 Tax=Streptomyces macrolidinus TaxID=2952607 RepID=A0ABT0ZLC4_9ACTN|nr:hypothetical protein [Streptomyces macrolidinus]MCN9244358.1 hypothetical protein [Streptomyces macrolidinus]